MGVYIKGMEMPKDCGTCRIRFNNGHHDVCAIERGKHLYDWEYIIGFPDWCPLVELKPHSRLIDANAVLKELDKMMVEGEVFTTAVNFAQTVINEAPTVIEAEGSGQ